MSGSQEDRSHDLGDERGPTGDKPVVAFSYDRGLNSLEVLDQTLLPKTISYTTVSDSDKGHFVIKSMMVRGAPAIAAVGCLAVIAELCHTPRAHEADFDILSWLKVKSAYMITSRPTGVNLRNSLEQLNEYAAKLQADMSNSQLIATLRSYCLDALNEGVMWNVKLGDFGADEIMKRYDNTRVTVLTHCNTGSLATVGYGTALGVIRSLHKRGVLEHVYCTETRPYNQGSRLTAFELVEERIPATLIADSMVACLMSSHKIHAVLVGADCVASNGDTANKIGTFQLAVLANHFAVPFYVAAPTQSFDLRLKDSSGINIECRSPDELKHLKGIPLAPEKINVWNPGFDVTPGHLISGMITEFGVCQPSRIDVFYPEVVKDQKQKNNQLLF